MRSEDAIARPLAAAVALFVTCAVFFVVSAMHTKLYYYVPALHLWTWDPPPRHIAMDWFYRAGLSLSLGALTAPIALAIARRLPPARVAGSTRLFFGLAFGVMLWCALYVSFALSVTPRAKTPSTQTRDDD